MNRIFGRAVWTVGTAIAFAAGTAGFARASEREVVVVNGTREPVPVAVQGTVPVAVQAPSSAPVFVRQVADPYQRPISITSGSTGEYCVVLDVPAGKGIVLRHVSGIVNYIGPARPRVWARARFAFPTSSRIVRSPLHVTDLDEGSAEPGFHRWAAHLDLLGFQGADAGNGGTLTEWRVCIDVRESDTSLDFIGLASGYLEDAN